MNENGDFQGGFWSILLEELLLDILRFNLKLYLIST